MRNPFRRDLIFLHPPSIYDFRGKDVFLGPIADAVPSTGEFEMYPVGLTSIASFLEKNHYNVQIVNLAHRMMQRSRFDVERYISRQEATVFGIDLHWLPHAQGALAIAELVKRLHPKSLVLFGGLSASYYHDELINYPFVDFVIRGDSTEEPVRQLLQALREGSGLSAVENLTWKAADGSAVVNPLTFIPTDLDYVDVPDYRYAMRSVFKYGNLSNLIPYIEWMRYPLTMILNSRGCTQDCSVCGGSASAYRRIGLRSRPAYRSPEKLAADVKTITSFSRAPIFMVHDPRIGGMTRCREIFAKLQALDLPNELILELFFPANGEFFTMVENSVRWSLEMTIESHDEELRRINGKFPFSNEQLESTIAGALAHGCRKLDLFFMVGIPHQTYGQALASVDYYRHLLERFGEGGKLHAYVSPLSPFLDPGSRAFEDSSFGYQVRYRTLEEHRQALTQLSWKDMLSFETDEMSREEIARASYLVAGELNELKYKHGLIDVATYSAVSHSLAAAEAVLGEIDRTASLPVDKRAAALTMIRRQIQTANGAALCGVDELKWPLSQRFHVGSTLARGLAGGLLREFRYTAARVAGSYDVAPFEGRRAEASS
ncbi:MAG: TIGR04190 family B12-binding domain/radical SAM domain protein [Acidimicrobiia bacterium]|nr:TIGR04190 family B12-binding domain/radical SAM domain protein [Acidimicrobiia bacterium]